MKSRVAISVLAVIGLVALSATAAQAAGGSPFPLTSFFVCQGINGDAPVNADGSAVQVAVTGSSLGTNPQQAKLGNGTLACAVAKLFPAGSVQIACTAPKQPAGCTEIFPNPGMLKSDGLRCYSVVAPRKSDPVGLPLRLDITDDLFPGGTDNNVPVTSFQYICAPAMFTGH